MDLENVNLLPSHPVNLIKTKATLRHCIFFSNLWGRSPSILSPLARYTPKAVLLAKELGNEKTREGGNVKILIRKYNLIEHVLNQMY